MEHEQGQAGRDVAVDDLAARVGQGQLALVDQADQTGDERGQETQQKTPIGKAFEFGLAPAQVTQGQQNAQQIEGDGEMHGHKSCGDLRGYKADIWDGGHREPFIARWPNRIEPGSTSDETICLADLMATCAGIVGTELPDNAAEDSYNILPVLLGEERDKPVRDAIVHHSIDGMFSVREGKWKLILGRGSGGFSQPRRIEPAPGEPRGQLYDMESDTAETNNLWSERPEIVQRLTALLDRYRYEGCS